MRIAPAAPRRALLLAAALGLGPLAGCFLVPPATGDGGSTGDGGFGYGKPTLELTINGVHFGPSAPDPGSGARYVVTRDGFTGRVTSSVFRVDVSSGATGAACQLTAQRTGDGVAPIGIAAYSISGGSIGPTPDGTVTPVGGEAVGVPQGTWQCSGNGCSGGVFSLVALDAQHAEGFFAGVYQNTAGAGAAQVVCSFYVPVLQLQP